MIFRCTGGLQFKRETHPFLQNTYHWASNRRTQGFHSCLLYLIQNSLIHISLTYVSAPLFQVTYQSKLLTTAILPNILLWSRTYNTRQWLGIITLAIGVAIVVTLGEEGGSESNESLIYSDKSTFLDWCLSQSLVCAARLLVSILKRSWRYKMKLPRHLYGCRISSYPSSFWREISSLLEDDSTSGQKKGFFFGFTLWVFWQAFLLGDWLLVVATVI